MPVDEEVRTNNGAAKGSGDTAIRAGLIGYGVAGRVFHAPLLAAAGIEVAAVASSRAEEVQTAFRSAEVLREPEALLARDDLDLVVIASPNASHYPLARAALLAGRHVVVDKPFTLSTEEADDLLALAEREGRMLSVFQNRRWDSDFLTLKACVERGELGEIAFYQARFDRFRPTVAGAWRDRDEPGSGILFDLGSHLIDQALSLFGWPDWLYADLAVQRQGAVTDDSFLVTLGKGNMRIVLGASMLAANPAPRFVVHGTHGSFVKSGIDVQESQLRAGSQPNDAGFGEEPDDLRATVTVAGASGLETRRESSCVGRYIDYYAGVRRAIETGAEPPVSARAGRDVIRLIELAQQSHREGRRLDLREYR